MLERRHQAALRTQMLVPASVLGLITWRGAPATYIIDFQVPFFPRPFEINYRLFVFKAEFFEDYVSSMCPRTPMVCVEDQLLLSVVCSVAHGIYAQQMGR